MTTSVHLSHADFFTKLTELLTTRHTKGHGSVFLSQKRLSHPTDTTSSPTSPTQTKPQHDDFSDLNPSAPLPLIIRATDGKGKRAKTAKVKASTIVQPEEIETFYARYAEVCKAGMGVGLKKRDRKGRKAKRRKAGAGAGTGAGATEKS